MFSNLQQMFNDGRFVSTGYMSILPVDQGNEHAGGEYFAPNPDHFDPENIVELAIEGGCNGVATKLPILGRTARQYARRIPLILKFNRNDKPVSAAVGATIYFGSEDSVWRKELLVDSAALWTGGPAYLISLPVRISDTARPQAIHYDQGPTSSHTSNCPGYEVLRIRRIPVLARSRIRSSLPAATTASGRKRSDMPALGLVATWAETRRASGQRSTGVILTNCRKVGYQYFTPNRWSGCSESAETKAFRGISCCERIDTCCRRRRERTDGGGTANWEIRFRMSAEMEKSMFSVVTDNAHFGPRADDVSFRENTGFLERRRYDMRRGS